jgi:hypothetical protein
MLSTRKINFSLRNGHLLGLQHLLLHREGLRKLKYENRKPACKTAVNRVTKTTEIKRSRNKQSPTFLRYDKGHVENGASGNSSLPQELFYLAVD